MSFRLTGGNRPTLNCPPGRTKQSHVEECDINVIMGKAHKTGVISFVSKREPEYMDVEQIDYQEAVNRVMAAEEMFLDMPAKLRRRFNNNPGEFLTFIQNPENIEEARDLGLVERLPPSAPPDDQEESSSDSQ